MKKKRDEKLQLKYNKELAKTIIRQSLSIRISYE